MTSKIIKINEFTASQVSGLNKSIIECHNKQTGYREKHCLVRKGDLESCIGSIFYRGYDGKYKQLPIEKMAGLLLYRIAQSQSFENGNKRTAISTCYCFLNNNGYRLKLEDNKSKINELVWGFACSSSAPAKYGEGDAIQFVKNRIHLIELNHS